MSTGRIISCPNIILFAVKPVCMFTVAHMAPVISWKCMSQCHCKHTFYKQWITCNIGLLYRSICPFAYGRYGVVRVFEITAKYVSHEDPSLVCVNLKRAYDLGNESFNQWHCYLFYTLVRDCITFYPLRKLVNHHNDVAIPSNWFCKWPYDIYMYFFS